MRPASDKTPLLQSNEAGSSDSPASINSSYAATASHGKSANDGFGSKLNTSSRATATTTSNSNSNSNSSNYNAPLHSGGTRTSPPPPPLSTAAASPGKHSAASVVTRATANASTATPIGAIAPLPAAAIRLSKGGGAGAGAGAGAGHGQLLASSHSSPYMGASHSSSTTTPALAVAAAAEPALNTISSALYDLTKTAEEKDRFDRSYSRHINYDLPETRQSSAKHTRLLPFANLSLNTAVGAAHPTANNPPFANNPSAFSPRVPVGANGNIAAPLSQYYSSADMNYLFSNAFQPPNTFSTIGNYSSPLSSPGQRAAYDNPNSAQTVTTSPSAPANYLRPASPSNLSLHTSLQGMAGAQAAVSAAVAAAARKEKNYNRFVALPDIKNPSEMTQAPTPVQPTLEDDLSVIKTQATETQPSSILGARARISVYCTAGAYTTKKLRQYLSEKYRDTQFDGQLPLWFHEAMYAKYIDAEGRSNVCLGDVIYFDYGVVIMWGLSRAQEADVLTELSNFESTPLDAFEVQVDQFELRYSPDEQPRIHNDIITINNLDDHHCKLAISHALSQSTKLCVFEERIEQTIESSKHIPGDLALTGKVQLSRVAIAKKIGHLFMQKSAVNLLTDVLDTPEFFWSAPDHLQGLYKAVRQYMEISARVEVLNTRLMVLQDMLEMLKDQQDQLHSTRLEYIVIILISVEVLIGLASVIVDLFRL